MSRFVDDLSSAGSRPAKWVGSERPSAGAETIDRRARGAEGRREVVVELRPTSHGRHKRLA